MGKRLVVLHEGYGCDTGCCGHSIRLKDSSPPGYSQDDTICWERVGDFKFAHPHDADFRGFAEYLVREAGCDPTDLDWENSVIVDD